MAAFVNSTVPIQAMSLLATATGHLANLSTAAFDAAAITCGENPTFPVPEMVVVPGGSFLMGRGGASNLSFITGVTTIP